jgi:hypothetical protein
LILGVRVYIFGKAFLASIIDEFDRFRVILYASDRKAPNLFIGSSG